MSESVDIEKIKQTMSKTLSVEMDKLVDDALIVEDLGADSLDMAELSMALQETCEIEISDDQLAQIRTVRDVINIVSTATAKNG